jgi:hypothetical protein
MNYRVRKQLGFEAPPFDQNNHVPHVGGCREWCKIHWYYDFAAQDRLPYPTRVYWPLPSTDNKKQWGNTLVHVGPPGYYPKRPTQIQMTNMAAYCPHTQGDLTCGTCLRHTFHPLEI